MQEVNGLIVPVVLGGMVIGAWQGYKLGPSIEHVNSSQNQLVNLINPR